MEILDCVVVGAGQAGLGMSYYLKKNGFKHIVIERGRIGETWLSQRWDSFKLNTINRINVLPGKSYEGPEPDGFWRIEELIDYFHQYIDEFQLPVRTGVTVLSIRQSEDGGFFDIIIADEAQVQSSILSRSVVIASGVQNTPKIPAYQAEIPKHITQLHTASYRSSAELPPGAVVVVGSGQSGCQIAEDLLAAGRKVFLCTSKVGRVPRRYRGRDLLEWWLDIGILDTTIDTLEDKSVIRSAQPQVSGVGRHGHSVSLQWLASQGVTILGRLIGIEASTLVFGEDAADNVHFADEFSQRVKEGIDQYLENRGITPPPLELDPADVPDSKAECVSPLRKLELGDDQISTIIWATGFQADFKWIHLPVFDLHGKPVYHRGISSLPGLYFLGLPWLNSRKSGIIYGIGDDASFIAADIASRMAASFMAYNHEISTGFV